MLFSRKFHLIVPAVALFLASCSTPIASNAANNAAKLNIGINTNEVMQIDSSVPFVDVFKMSLPFDEAVKTKLTYGRISYDQNGWVNNLNGGQAGTNLLHWLPAGTLPDGNYTVLYEGQGKMEYTDDARLVSSAPGKDIIHIAAGHDTYIKVTLLIKQTNPADYIRNIRVLLPGGICRGNPFKRVNSAGQCGGANNYLSFAEHHEQILFNPDYLRFMRDFKTLRFMNMSGITRNDKLIAWSQMPHMQQATWAGNPGRRGAPLEVMVKLANILNANAWFNLPERANDDLVRRYAEYVKTHLKPHLKVYLEYTNEAWNPIFSSAKYARTMGLKLKLDPDFNKAQQKFYVKRSLEIFRIWKQVYGNTNKLVRVLGAWAANPKMSEFLLSYNGAHRQVDAIGIAPYFHVHRKVNKEINSVPSVFRLLEDDRNPYSLNNVRKMIEKQMVIARKYNIGLLAYEGGQHLYAPGTHSSKDYPNNFYIGANRARTMETLYVKSLEDWKQVTGGQLYVTFSSPRTYQAYGSWGVKEHINQPEHMAPKYRAIMKFIR
jgi:hypothetical protein